MNTKEEVLHAFKMKAREIIFSGRSYMYTDGWYENLLEKLEFLEGNAREFMKIEDEIVAEYFHRKKAVAPRSANSLVAA